MMQMMLDEQLKYNERRIHLLMQALVMALVMAIGIVWCFIDSEFWTIRGALRTVAVYWILVVGELVFIAYRARRGS